MKLGLNSGWEYAHIFDTKTGDLFLKKTTRSPNSVSFDRHEMELFRNSKNRLELTHNHPSSSSLSVPDLRMGTYDGVERVVAVGHDGSVYSAKSLADIESYHPVSKKIDQEIEHIFWPLIRSGDLEIEDANMLHGHIRNQVFSRFGMLDYQVENFGNTLSASLDVFPDNPDDIVEQIHEILEGEI